MKYYMVTVKCGHVGRGKYYKGTLFISAENGREAAKKARENPRVKHDHKDAILSVDQIDEIIYEAGIELNFSLPYYKCENVQQQRLIYEDIENNIFIDEDTLSSNNIYVKKRNLRKVYNIDPDYDIYKKNRCLELISA